VCSALNRFVCPVCSAAVARFHTLKSQGVYYHPSIPNLLLFYFLVIIRTDIRLLPVTAAPHPFPVLALLFSNPPPNLVGGDVMLINETQHKKNRKIS
jgi:hypothetical protein